MIKKILLLVLLVFGLVPVMKKGRLSVDVGTVCVAQSGIDLFEVDICGENTESVEATDDAYGTMYATISCYITKDCDTHEQIGDPLGCQVAYNYVAAPVDDDWRDDYEDELPPTENENEPDCNGDINGGAYIDACGTCVGGNTGRAVKKWFVDLDGDGWGGTEYKICYNPGAGYTLKGGDRNDRCYNLANAANQCPANPCDPLNAAAGLLATDRLKEVSAAARMDSLVNSVSLMDKEQGFYIGEDGNGFMSGPIANGDANRVTIPLPLNNSGISPKIKVHTHFQDNRAQSAGDLYGLAEEQGFYGSMEGEFVVTKDGTQYYVGISDPYKLSAFLATKDANYDPVTGGFKENSTIGRTFFDAKNGYIISGLNDDQADAAATAYILSKFDTGLILYKKNSSGNFKPTKSTKSSNVGGGDTYYTGGC